MYISLVVGRLARFGYTWCFSQFPTKYHGNGFLFKGCLMIPIEKNKIALNLAIAHFGITGGVTFHDRDQGCRVRYAFRSIGFNIDTFRWFLFGSHRLPVPPCIYVSKETFTWLLSWRILSSFNLNNDLQQNVGTSLLFFVSFF